MESNQICKWVLRAEVLASKSVKWRAFGISGVRWCWARSYDDETKQEVHEQGRNDQSLLSQGWMAHIQIASSARDSFFEWGVPNLRSGPCLFCVVEESLPEMCFSSVRPKWFRPPSMTHFQWISLAIIMIITKDWTSLDGLWRVQYRECLGSFYREHDEVTKTPNEIQSIRQRFLNFQIRYPPPQLS